MAAQTFVHPNIPLLDCYNYKSIHDHFFFFFFNNYDRIIINNIRFMMIIFYHHDFINFQFDGYNLNKKILFNISRSIIPSLT